MTECVRYPKIINMHFNLEEKCNKNIPTSPSHHLLSISLSLQIEIQIRILGQLTSSLVKTSEFLVISCFHLLFQMKNL